MGFLNLLFAPEFQFGQVETTLKRMMKMKFLSMIELADEIGPPAGSKRNGKTMKEPRMNEPIKE